MGASYAMHLGYVEMCEENERNSLSPNHPAMGNLSEEEFDESGYDGPMYYEGEEVTLKFTKDRETKNTVRYSEEGTTPVVGTIYLQKTSDLSKESALEITIKAA